MKRQIITEAVFDRYIAMFNPIINKVIRPMQNSEVAIEDINKRLEKIEKTVIPDLVSWAVRILRKQDRITWFLRMARVAILYHITVIPRGREDSKELLLEFSERHYEREFKVWAQSINSNIDTYTQEITRGILTVKSAADEYHYGFGFIINTLDHFFTQPIPEIQNFAIPKDMSPDLLFSTLRSLEEEWKARQNRYIPFSKESVTSGKITVLIQYENGAQWLNLNKSYCNTEAKAMGHCGNSGSAEAYETILSFRTIEKNPNTGKKAWVPHLTFILDTRTGMLGEMKGRGNQKPNKKYHGVIYDLLKLPLIKGITGGGYLPENNFELSDFPEEVAENLMDEKPELATLKHLYKKGATFIDLFDKIASLADSIWGDKGLQHFDHSTEKFYWFEFKGYMFKNNGLPVIGTLMEMLIGTNEIVVYESILNQFFDILSENIVEKYYDLMVYDSNTQVDYEKRTESKRELLKEYTATSHPLIKPLWYAKLFLEDQWSNIFSSEVEDEIKSVLNEWASNPSNSTEFNP